MIQILACLLLVMIALSACGKKQADQNQDRVFGSNRTGVILNADATFVANLYHGVVKTGTYAESTDADGVTTVTFTVDNNKPGTIKDKVTGTIVDDVLTIPPEWRDSHGHSSAFVLQ